VTDVLCYGDSNTWGCVPLVGLEPTRRFPPEVRWPGVLRRELGAGHWVVEAGANGRRTIWDDDLEPHRNGREELLPTLVAHHPLDLVVLMLGTNDLKARFDVPPRDIAEGAGVLVDDVRASPYGPDEGAPLVLLVCPPPLAALDRFAADFEGGVEKSHELAAYYAAVAEARGCAFLDAGAHVSASDTDGVHLDREAHHTLGRAVAAVVRDLLPNG